MHKAILGDKAKRKGSWPHSVGRFSGVKVPKVTEHEHEPQARILMF